MEKRALIVDKEQLEKELLGAETPFDKLLQKKGNMIDSGDDV